MSQSQEGDTTSHYATDEVYCYRMAKKYGWTLLEARRKLAARHPLTWECIFEGKAAFPKGSMDYSVGEDT